MAGRNSMRQREVDVWPGWVDALSSLLMVLIFLLMIFLVAQFYLTTALTGRDDLVSDLNRRIVELNDRLTMEVTTGRDLGDRLTRVATDLEAAIMERDLLARALAATERERDELDRRLADTQAQMATLVSGGEDSTQRLIEADQLLQAGQAELDDRLRELTRLRAEIDTAEAMRQDLQLQIATLDLALRTSRQEAEQAGIRAELSQREVLDLYGALADRDVRIADLTSDLDAREAALAARETRIAELAAELEGAATQQAELTDTLRLTAADRDRLDSELAEMRELAATLEARLAEPDEAAEQLQAQLAQTESEAAGLRQTLEDTEAALDLNRDALAATEDRAVELDARLAELQDELARVQDALFASEASVDAREIEIANLESRLNDALLRTVDELSRSRSAFFGQLVDVLGQRPGVRIVGDRFIFQSEVLFSLGSADLQEGGREQLAAFATTLLEIAEQFPEDVDWVLRIDGHTDRQPMVLGARFSSNWELSTQRALSVLYFLAERGVPEARMAAAGFGEFYPIDPEDTPAAYARNRRIELRLDARGDSEAPSDLVPSEPRLIESIAPTQPDLMP